MINLAIFIAPGSLTVLYLILRLICKIVVVNLICENKDLSDKKVKYIISMFANNKS